MKTDKERAEEILREGSIGLLKHGIIWNKVIDCMLEFHNERLREELIKFLIKREYPHAPLDPSLQVMVKYIVDDYLKSKE